MSSGQQNNNNKPFRITQDETIAEGVARVIHELLACMIGYLDNYQADPDSIHQTRVACKRLRAIAKLLRKSLPKPAKQLNAEIRDISRLLSLQRDAEVKLELIGQLINDADEDQQHLLQLLAEHYQEGAIDQQIIEKNVQLAKEKAIALGELVKSWKFKKMDQAKVFKALGNEWGLAKISYLQNQKDPDPVDMHTWRKHAKTCLYQSQLLETHLKAKYPQRIEKLKKLGTLLGQYHDLVLILEDIEEPIIADWNEAEQASLQGYIKNKQGKLLKKTLKIAKAVFEK
jgi:CHAD domain-containing protein